MDTTNRLTEWAIRKIETEYKEDIALLIAVTGHSTDGDGHGECFDYFIPATERGYELSQTFIIDGIGHDLYPRSWERVENMASLKDFPTLCLADAKILYSRTKEEEERFLGLQKKLSENLKDKIFTYSAALENLDAAMDVYRTLMFEDKRSMAWMAAGFIVRNLTKSIALINASYADSAVFTEEQAREGNAKNSLYHCPDMKEVPDSYFLYGKAMLKAKNIEEIRNLSYLLIEGTRRFLQERKPESCKDKKKSDFTELAGWYQELSLTWRRIRYFCDRHMVEEAYNDACYLQYELMIVTEEFGLPEIDLLDSYDSGNLKLLKEQSIKTEKEIRNILENHQVTVNEYPSVDAFLRSNK